MLNHVEASVERKKASMRDGAVRFIKPKKNMNVGTITDLDYADDIAALSICMRDAQELL